MAKKVVMEALSPTMEEGRVVTWHRREGDAVKSGDTIAEVETDKAVMELVARTDGTILRVVAGEGDTVPVGDVVAFIGTPGEELPAPSPAAPSPATQPQPSPEPASAAAPVSAEPEPAPLPVGPTQEPDGQAGRVKASPLARRLARDRQVDLRVVEGTGPGGRVVKRDIEAFVAAPTPSVSIPTGAAYEDVPVSQMRKTIARRLVQSIGPIPTFYLTAEADMERVAEAREALNTGNREPRISFNDVVLKATALALARHPSCNAWWQETHVRQWRDVHLGMAVAVEEGLITPIIRHADRKPLAEIAREGRELAERARARKLVPEEYTGATFTLSNLGMYGIDDFTAVINPPEAGILAVGSVTTKPVVAQGAVVVRRRMRVTMSCDHRVIDGATGAVFLQTLVQMLENPLAMLL
jgi:pyruvate dehydrogenase E2 component (dihydrolipoamide acetyltransferase)